MEMPLQGAKLKGVADIVFVLDVSGSMEPVIESVKNHIGAFVDSINQSSQMPIDLRLGLVVHASNDGDRQGVKAFPFTNDVAQFQNDLACCNSWSTGDEFGLPALDRALDFDWRGSCRRFVVSFTDEPVSGGMDVPLQVSKLGELKEKFADLHVNCYVIGPACPDYDELCTGPRMVRVRLNHEQLAVYDFGKFLSELGRTVSSTPEQQRTSKARANLYET